MADRPTSAFVLSLIGGTITLIVGLISIHSWSYLDSTVGGGFDYQTWPISVNFSAEAALLLFVTGAICGISIIVGAVMQYSGERSRVRRGSILVLVASIMGIPSTSFGWFIGGVLSVVGAAQGIAWKPLDKTASRRPELESQARQHSR